MSVAILGVSFIANLAVDSAKSIDLPEVYAFSNYCSTPKQSLSGPTLSELSSSSVADALKFFSGVQLKDYGGVGGQKTINVRSMGTQHTGIFIDGVRVTNTQNGQVDLSKYSLRNFEKVELYQANKIQPLMSASEYASASTVYFTTKIPDTTSIVVSASGGSFHSYSASISLLAKDKGFFDIESMYTTGRYKFHYSSQYEDTTGYRRNSDVFFFRCESAFSPTASVKLHSYFYYTDRGVPGGIVKRLSDKYGDVGREKELNGFIQCQVLKSISLLDYKAVLRYSYDRLHYNSDYPENCFVHCDNYYNQNDLYGALSVNRRFQYLSCSVSSDLRFSTLDCNVYGLSFIKRYDFKSSLSLSSCNLYFLNYPFVIHGNLLFSDVSDHSTMNVANPLKKFNCSMHMTYSIGHIALRGFYKQVHRVPTLNDLYYTNVGVRSLKPEQTTQFDVGCSYKSSNLDFQFDGYYNQVYDKIICIPQGGAYNWKMTNRGYVVIKGVDSSVRVSYPRWSLFYTVTIQDVRDMTDSKESSYNKQLLYSPTWSHSCILSCRVIPQLNVSCSGMYVGKRKWSYADDADILQRYFCLDLHSSLSLRKFVISCDIDNVLNHYYELVQRWPLPARRYKLSVKVTF